MSANTEAPSTDVGYAESCPNNYPSNSIPRLCHAGQRNIDTEALNVLQGMLRDGSVDEGTLCAIDALVVRSQDGCTQPRSDTDAYAVALLFMALASNWLQRGSLDRAEELYTAEYDILEQIYRDNRALTAPLMMPALQGRAVAELRRGRGEEARRLAGQQVALARVWYEESVHDRLLLVMALEFQAGILSEIGLTDEAQKAQHEAEALASQPPTCTGVCKTE